MAPFTLLVPLALVAQQIFKRHETYSIRAHLTLLLGPPVLASVLSSPGSGHPFARAFLLAHATYLSSLSAFVVLYRISSIHPLAKYPGPFWCKVSAWYMGCLSSGYEHLYISDLHRQFGDVVRIGPNELSIRDAAAIGPVMAQGTGMPKGPQYYGRMLSDGSALPLIGIQDPHEHLRRRRPWNRAFSATALREYEVTIAKRGKQLLDTLEREGMHAREKDKGRGEVVLGEMLNYFSYDFMCDLAFGGGSELLEGGDEKNVWKILEEGMMVGTLLAHVPWLGVYLSHLPFATGPLEVLISHCRKLTSERIRRGAVRQDLFHFLNGEDMPEQQRLEVPIRQLTDDGCLIVVAGADTASSTMTSIFYSLLTHPDMYKRLQAEVDHFYPQGEDPFNTKHHRDMHYLTAVINEALRVFPPLPGGSQRQVARDTPGVWAGSTYVPPGTSVWVHVWSVHRDPRNFFPLPDKFWPDRWLLPSSSISSSAASIPSSSATALPTCLRGTASGGVAVDVETFVHNEAAWIPFAAGSMNCVGKSLALQEIRMIVCAIMQRFDLQLAAGWDSSSYERDYKAYLVATRPKLPVTLTLRSNTTT